jgi:hypothetical protein
LTRAVEWRSGRQGPRAPPTAQEFSVRPLVPPWLRPLVLALLFTAPLFAFAQAGAQPFSKEQLDQLTAYNPDAGWTRVPSNP